ncbi:hypothetical protein BU23DRAFT_165599 [Bimuria novae-zelandiae CBS 107.79]|uniref:Secreted protein n=1 Tax=Bimuria novae-zelandiae CBS 107.79 TaxID=1447943 RepID=A0A6A5V5D1_9PLEO|nr:hypothetical protein BU23DRAFT_165599 [Bimuria novae-zelandiae CBS 107.79]
MCLGAILPLQLTSIVVLQADLFSFIFFKRCYRTLYINNIRLQNSATERPVVSSEKRIVKVHGIVSLFVVNHKILQRTCVLVFVQQLIAHHVGHERILAVETARDVRTIVFGLTL